MAVEIAQAYVSLIPSFKGGKAAIQKELGDAADGAASAAGASSGGIFSGSFGKALKAGAAIAGVGAIAVGLKNVGSAAISAASDLGETSSKVEQIFGSAQASAIDAWASTASSAFGQSKQQAMDAAASFAIFGKSAGLQGQALTTFSTDLTQLSSDLASFSNTSPEEAIMAIGSALRGEAEPIRKYGVLMDDAAMKQAIFEQTGKKVTGTLTPQQKVLAAQALILKQTSDAQGDFARTSDGLANSQRTLEAAMADLKSQVGAGLLPAMTSLVSAIAPVAGSLAEPLGKVADAVGGALSQAFTALAPVLPVLADALGTIAGVLGNVLSAAISALVPIMQPMLTTFSDLATRIGPMLEPLLVKLGELLGKVLAAVMPLLPPLMDLVFTILEAAMPILDIVVDLFGVLVDALAPLIGVVASLLPTLGQLVNVVFAAIMPILKPLLPLIQVLADVFGNILARAIGVIVTAFGGLILAGSKVAPFLLNNLIKPVVSGFLTFAENIVGAAAAAFSWVPGLGDKLGEAKTAIGKFKTDATKAIGDAATTIETEGAKIGKGLIDQGVMLATNPSEIAKVRSAGLGVGGAMSDGMAIGIANGQIPVAAAAAANVRAAERAARAEAQSNSPSKLFAAVGADLTEGLIQGVKSKDAGKALREQYAEWYQASVDKLKSKLDEAKNYAMKWRDQMIGYLDMGRALQLANDKDARAADALASLKEAEAKVAEANQALSEAESESSKKSAQAAVDAANVTLGQAQSAYQSAATAAATSWVDEWRNQLTNSANFIGLLQQLKNSGAHQAIISQIAAAGPEAGTQMATDLINGGAAGTGGLIDEFNTGFVNFETAATNLGVNFANTWGNDTGTKLGGLTAQKTLDAFRASFGKDGDGRARLNRVMDNLAASAARSVRIDVEVTRNINEVVTRVVQEIAAPKEGRAAGGPVMSNTAYWVGEKGPEILVMGSQPGTIIPNSAIGVMGSSAGMAAPAGGPAVINLDVRIGDTPLNDLVDARIDSADADNLRLVLAGAAS